MSPGCHSNMPRSSRKRIVKGLRNLSGRASVTNHSPLLGGAGSVLLRKPRSMMTSLLFRLTN